MIVKLKRAKEGI